MVPSRLACPRARTEQTEQTVSRNDATAQRQLVEACEDWPQKAQNPFARKASSRVSAATVKPLPSYRVYGCLSPMFDLGLYVTDRRILTIAYAARLLTQEFSQWFDGRTPPEDGEVVKAVRSERWGSLPYLEVISGNPLTNCVFVSDVSPQIAACSMVAEEEE